MTRKKLTLSRQLTLEQFTTQQLLVPPDLEVFSVIFRKMFVEFLRNRRIRGLRAGFVIVFWLYQQLDVMSPKIAKNSQIDGLSQ